MQPKLGSLLQGREVNWTLNNPTLSKSLEFGGKSKKIAEFKLQELLLLECTDGAQGWGRGQPSVLNRGIIKQARTQFNGMHSTSAKSKQSNLNFNAWPFRQNSLFSRFPYLRKLYWQTVPPSGMTLVFCMKGKFCVWTAWQSSKSK